MQRRRRTFGCIIAAAAGLSLVGIPAYACIPFQYESAITYGKVLTSRGDWASFSMETDRSLARIEYTSSGPTGRSAIIGNLDENWGYAFPVGLKQPAFRSPARASLQDLIDQAGLPGWAFAQSTSYRTTTKSHQGMRCLLSDAQDWPLRGEKGAHVCLRKGHAEFTEGVPLFAEDATGKRVLETQKIELRTVPLARFNPPRPKSAPVIVAQRSSTSC